MCQRTRQPLKDTFELKIRLCVLDFPVHLRLCGICVLKTATGAIVAEIPVVFLLALRGSRVRYKGGESAVGKVTANTYIRFTVNSYASYTVRPKCYSSLNRMFGANLDVRPSLSGASGAS